MLEANEIRMILIQGRTNVTSHTAVWVLAPGKALQKTSERVSKEIQGHYNRLTLYFVPYIVN